MLLIQRAEVLNTWAGLNWSITTWVKTPTKTVWAITCSSGSDVPMMFFMPRFMIEHRKHLLEAGMGHSHGVFQLRLPCILGHPEHVILTRDAIGE